MSIRSSWRSRPALGGVLAGALLAAAAMALAPAPASAVIVQLPNGKALSYQPLRTSASAGKPFDAFFTNLDYNGGPVMASNTNYAVYWRPASGPAYPSDYQAGVNQYFSDLAHDSGGHENTDSVSAQYNDAAGEFANYDSHFGGALIDTDPYPANGCKQATICLTDAQLTAELVKFVKAQGLPTDLAHEYFLLTPKGVEDCFEASGSECSAGSKKPIYCAYHGNVPVGEGELIYANDPFVTGNLSCDDGNHPNGSSSDGVLEGGLSHEHNESTTDPEPNDANAWTDFATGETTGFEVGDKCVEEGPGPALGTAPNGAEYNQVINGHEYWYQEEWSNQGSACLQRLTLSGAEPTASFTSKPVAGNEMSFDASASTAAGGVARYDWQFNDGAFGPGEPVETTTPAVAHKFPTKGPFVVALTVFAKDGTSIGTAKVVATGQQPPSPAFTVTTPTPTAGQAVSFSGSGSSAPGGSIAGYQWNFGDGSSGTGSAPSHTYATPGTFTVTLTVKDSFGQTAAVSHQVVVDESPTASFSLNPLEPTAGQPVSFNGTSSIDPDGSIVAYSWSFGDGTPVGSGPAPTHAYAAPGSYTVTLTVTDSDGATNAASRPLTVAPAPSAPPTALATVAGALASLARLPDSNFSVRAARPNPRTGAITFTASVVDPGTFSWLLTFQNGRVGVFARPGVLASDSASCRGGLIRLRGKCRPAKILFARGRVVVREPGTVTFTVRPSAAALTALGSAFSRRRGLPVAVTLAFQSSRGGRPVSHHRSLTVRLRKPS